MTSEAKKDGVTFEAKKDGVTFEAKKDGVTFEAKKDSVTSEAKKDGVTSEAKMDGVTSEAKKDGDSRAADTRRISQLLDEIDLLYRVQKIRDNFTTPDCSEATLYKLIDLKKENDRAIDKNYVELALIIMKLCRNKKRNTK